MIIRLPILLCIYYARNKEKNSVFLCHNFPTENEKKKHKATEMGFYRHMLKIHSNEKETVEIPGAHNEEGRIGGCNTLVWREVWPEEN